MMKTNSWVWWAGSALLAAGLAAPGGAQDEPLVTIREITPGVAARRAPVRPATRPPARPQERPRARLMPRAAPTQRRGQAAAPPVGGGAVGLNNRAYRLQLQGRHAEAEPLLRRALALNPGYAYAQYNLGWSLLMQGRASEAVGWLLKTSARQPRRWEPVLRLAQAYEQMGRKEAALPLYARARALGYRGRMAAR
jgi:Flp pilus assembly protein TadD